MSALVSSYTGPVWYPEQVSATGKRLTSGWTRGPGVLRNLRSYRARSAGPRVSLRVDMTSAVKFRANAGGAADGRSSLHAARAAAMRPRAMADRNAITQWRQDRRSDPGAAISVPGPGSV